MSSIANTLLQDALDTRDTHGGCISNGGWVLLTLANIASPELSNSSRVKSYDDLISHVQHCIGAGCEPLLSPAPAQESQSASIPAPAEAGQGQGTSFDLFAQPPVIQPSGSVGELAEIITDAVMDVYHDTQVGEAMCSIDVHAAIKTALAAAKLNGEVERGQGTITLEQFQRWLEDQAHAARFAIEDGCDFFDRTAVHEPTIAACQLATAMVMRFKQGFGNAEAFNLHTPFIAEVQASSEVKA